jgi:hypothetical protein
MTADPKETGTYWSHTEDDAVFRKGGHKVPNKLADRDI